MRKYGVSVRAIGLKFWCSPVPPKYPTELPLCRNQGFEGHCFRHFGGPKKPRANAFGVEGSGRRVRDLQA